MASYTQQYAAEDGQLVFNYAAAYQKHTVTGILMHEKEIPITIHIRLLPSDSECTAGTIILCL
jgi:hypothetical protein